MNLNMEVEDFKLYRKADKDLHIRVSQKTYDFIKDNNIDMKQLVEVVIHKFMKFRHRKRRK